MAFPARLPARLKSAARPLAKVTKVITPTGIAVILSVGAHLALIAFGPRTEVSFAALSQAAQEADAEETLVPVMQLSAAERDRLPSFAQPRREPPSATGLRSLSLPPGLPFSPSTSTFRRRPVPANTLPSPTKTTKSRSGPVRGTFPSGLTGGLPSFKPNFSTRPVPQPSNSSQQYVGVIPDPPPRLPVPADNGVRLSTEGLEGNNSGLPNLSPGASSSNPKTLADVLRETEAARIAASPGTASPDTPAPSPGNAVAPDGSDSEAGESTPTEAPVVAKAPAQGDPLQLMNSNEYDKRNVTEAEAKANTDKWLSETAVGRDNVAQTTAEIGINSGFKSCREQPPVFGQIGVVASPDGSKENATVLKSTGYDFLNSLALRTLEYEDFGQPEVPTQYIVDVKVLYAPEDCAQDLPDAPPAE